MVIEHRSDVKCATGSVSFGIVEILFGGELELLLDQSGGGRLPVAANAEWLKQLEVGHVLRFTRPDGTPLEMRVTGIRRGRGRDHHIAWVSLTSIAHDLGHGLVRQRVAGGATQYVVGMDTALDEEIIDSLVIPALHDLGKTWISRGVVESPQVVTLPPAIRSPLETIRALEAATQKEFRLVRLANDTGYEIELLEQVGAGGPQVLVQVDRNISDMEWDRGRSGDFATAVVPLGMTVQGATEPATIGRAVLVVEAVDAGASTLTLAIPDSVQDPVLKDGMWKQRYLLRQDGTLVQIDDTTAPKTFHMPDITGFSVGDHVEIRADANGALLTAIEDPAAAVIIERTWTEPEMRGERNHVPNPAAADGQHTSDAISARIASTTTSTSVALKELPPNAAIAAGDTFVMWSRPNAGAATEVRVIATGGTADASGNATIVVSGPAIGQSTDDEVMVYRKGVLPTGWEMSSHLCWHRARIGASGMAGEVDGNQTDVRRIALRLLLPNTQISTGDKITIAGNTYRIMAPAMTDAAGKTRVEIVSRITVTDGAVVSIEPPATPSEIGAPSGLIMPCWTGTVLGVTPARSPLYTVRYTPPGEPLWFSAAITYIGTGSLAPFSGGPPYNLSPARLRLLDDTGAVLVPAVNDVAQTLEADGETSVILRGEYQLTATKRLRVEVTGVLDEQPNFWKPGEPFTRLEWVMIHLGPDPSPPATRHSHGSLLLATGLTVLSGHGPDTGDLFEVTARDLAMDPNYNAADETIDIGISVRQYDPELGLHREGRIVGLRWDPASPRSSTRWLIDTRSHAFTRALARQ